MRNNQDFLDAVSLVSFVIGLANYNENLTQNDKAELMNKLDVQTRDILSEIEKAIKVQNEMLSDIQNRLEKLEKSKK